MPYETILYEIDNGKARITLNRPEKLNAISWGMRQEMKGALEWRDSKFGGGRAKAKAD